MIQGVGSRVPPRKGPKPPTYTPAPMIPHAALPNPPRTTTSLLTHPTCGGNQLPSLGTHTTCGGGAADQSIVHIHLWGLEISKEVLKQIPKGILKRILKELLKNLKEIRKENRHQILKRGIHHSAPHSCLATSLPNPNPAHTTLLTPQPHSAGGGI